MRKTLRNKERSDRESEIGGSLRVIYRPFVSEDEIITEEKKNLTLEVSDYAGVISIFRDVFPTVLCACGIINFLTVPSFCVGL